MGAQFSEEFLLGYRAGHRDGFADAVLLMRDATTPHHQGIAVARREAQLARLLSGEGLVLPTIVLPNTSEHPSATDVPRNS